MTETPYGRVQVDPLPEHGLEAGDAWQVVIGTYLAKRCDMQPPDMFEVLCKCELDEVTRARYLRMAREIVP